MNSGIRKVVNLGNGSKPAVWYWAWAEGNCRGSTHGNFPSKGMDSIEVLTHKEQLLQSILGLEVNTAVTSHKTKQGNSLSWIRIWMVYICACVRGCYPCELLRGIADSQKLIPCSAVRSPATQEVQMQEDLNSIVTWAWGSCHWHICSQCTGRWTV